MNEIIRQWLIEVLGYDDQHVFRAGQEGPVPIGDYATYTILQVVPSSGSIKSEADKGVDDDIIRTWYNRGTLIAQVDVYANDGWSKQHSLKQSSRLLSVRKILQPNYVSLIRSGTITGVNELIDTKYKQRFTCDHSFLIWNTVIEEDQKVNGGYVITGEYQPGDETVVIDVTP